MPGPIHRTHGDSVLEKLRNLPLPYAYTLPFVAYLVGTIFISRFSEQVYPIAYGVVAALVAFLTWALVRRRRLFQPHWRVAPGVIVGLVGIGLWIVLCQLHLEKSLASFLPTFLQPSDRVSYNPFEELSPWMTAIFIAVRLFGIAVLVPIAEELFWRGFLLRWLIDVDWQKVRLGEFSWQSFGIVTLMFTAAHPEWFAAAAYCMLINCLLYWKKDLWQCIVAHAVSNLVLVIYVLISKEWWLW
jgi:CAAX prenyl protease-like protein